MKIFVMLSVLFEKEIIYKINICVCGNAIHEFLL